jgi:HemY protein
VLDGAPVPLLLAAEAPGNRATATWRGVFAKLLERPETEFLGLRGLVGEALKSGDDAVARRFAERARKLRPASPWLADNVLMLQARAADWPAAAQTIADAARRGALPGARARHARGVVLYQQSRAAGHDDDLRAAAALAARAQALARDLPELAAYHARLLPACSATGRRGGRSSAPGGRCRIPISRGSISTRIVPSSRWRRRRRCSVSRRKILMPPKATSRSPRPR